MWRACSGARSSSRCRARRALTGGFEIFGTVIPHYNLFIIVLGPALAIACWLLLSRTGTGRMIRAAAYDREMLARSAPMSASSIR